MPAALLLLAQLLFTQAPAGGEGPPPAPAAPAPQPGPPIELPPPAQAPAPAAVLPPPPLPAVEEAVADAGVEGVPPGGLRFHAAAEADFTSFPSGTPGGQQDVLFDVRPILGLELGPDFAAEVGAEFRLRMIDDAPGQRAGDIGGILRRQDWDEASDFGQIIRSLRINQPTRVFSVQVGPVRKKTLGLGHLLTRYSNRDNPDYHPAAATVGVLYRAVNLQLFASDIFAARIFAGELALDLGRIFADNPDVFDRFHFSGSMAHDFGLAGYVAPPATLVELDFDAVLYRSSDLRLMALVGFGTRVDKTNDVGFVAGLAVDATLAGFSVGGKLEGRKHNGGYRQGFFGAGYELARFAGVGLSGVPRADERLPDGFSLSGELHLARGTFVSLDVEVEHFFFGRTDADALFSLAVLGERLVAGARFTGVGLGLGAPRYSGGAEARLRLFASLYLLASGGTVFFPQADGTLVRGFFFGGGAGLDFER